jgi:hypothetical protein
MEQTRNTTKTHFDIKWKKEGRKGTATYQNNSSTRQKTVIFILNNFNPASLGSQYTSLRHYIQPNI